QRDLRAGGLQEAEPQDHTATPSPSCPPSTAGGDALPSRGASTSSPQPAPNPSLPAADRPEATPPQPRRPHLKPTTSDDPPSRLEGVEQDEPCPTVPPSHPMHVETNGQSRTDPPVSGAGRPGAGAGLR